MIVGDKFICKKAGNFEHDRVFEVGKEYVVTYCDFKVAILNATPFIYEIFKEYFFLNNQELRKAKLEELNEKN